MALLRKQGIPLAPLKINKLFIKLLLYISQYIKFKSYALAYFAKETESSLFSNSTTLYPFSHSTHCWMHTKVTYVNHHPWQYIKFLAPKRQFVGENDGKVGHNIAKCFYAPVVLALWLETKCPRFSLVVL